MYYFIKYIFFSIIDLYFLDIAVIAQTFIPAVELAIHAGIPTKDAKVEIEIHPVTVEFKISSGSI